MAHEEARALELMEPILVANLRKLLMLSVDCRVPLETVGLVGPELGLPPDFEERLVPSYPQFFSVRRVNGRDCLCLEDWDSTLAVTVREARYTTLHLWFLLNFNCYIRKNRFWPKHVLFLFIFH